MHRIFARTLTGALLATSPLLALAADESGWSGTGELGLAAASGNTDTQNFVAKLDLAQQGEQWKNAFGANFQYGKSDGEETAYRYELFGTTGYRLGDRSYLFGSLRNQRDHFAAYEYEWTAAGGYGYEAIKGEKTHLTFEVGPGYRWSKVQDARIHANEAILRGWMDFGTRLTETTSLVNTLLIEAGSDNTYLNNDFGVQVQMSQALALKAGLEVRHNTDVLPGIKKTDTLTTVNVVYGF